MLFNKTMWSSIVGAMLLLCLVASDVFAHETATWSDIADESQAASVESDDDFKLTIASEFGLLSVMYNKIQQGQNGTYFDYVKDGGQELFTPFLRASGELKWKGRHTAVLLYQPINLETRVRFRDDVVVDDRVFSEGQMMDLRYGFDFFRASYMFDVLAREDMELSLGGGFQMRIAAIEFVPVDGSDGRLSKDLGPVPLLKLRYRHNLEKGWFYGTEIDGFYANIKVLNGDIENEVTGAIYDASLRGGKTLGDGLDAFVNVRFLGGGGVGTSQDDARDNPGDGYVKNWLHAATISLGFYFEPAALVR